MTDRIRGAARLRGASAPVSRSWAVRLPAGAASMYQPRGALIAPKPAPRRRHVATQDLGGALVLAGGMAATTVQLRTRTAH